MIKWGLAAASVLALALVAGCAASAASQSPALVAQPVSARPDQPATAELGLLGSTFAYDSTTATATCAHGLGTVTAADTWTSSGTGTHVIEVAGTRKTYATAAGSGAETATFSGLKPGKYYVTFSSTDGAAAREKVAVCG